MVASSAPGSWGVSVDGTAPPDGGVREPLGPAPFSRCERVPVEAGLGDLHAEIPSALADAFCAGGERSRRPRPGCTHSTVRAQGSLPAHVENAPRGAATRRTSLTPSRGSNSAAAFNGCPKAGDCRTRASRRESRVWVRRPCSMPTYSAAASQARGDSWGYRRRVGLSRRLCGVASSTASGRSTRCWNAVGEIGPSSWISRWKYQGSPTVALMCVLLCGRMPTKMRPADSSSVSAQNDSFQTTLATETGVTRGRAGRDAPCGGGSPGLWRWMPRFSSVGPPECRRRIGRSRFRSATRRRRGLPSADGPHPER